MVATDRRAVIRSLQRCNGGAEVITQAEFMRFLGLKNRAAARRILSPLPAFRAGKEKYYLVADVADLWLQNLTNPGQ